MMEGGEFIITLYENTTFSAIVKESVKPQVHKDWSQEGSVESGFTV